MSSRLIYEGLEYMFLPWHCTPQLPFQVEHFVHYFLNTYFKNCHKLGLKPDDKLLSL